MKEDRSLFVMVLLAIVTCGIYAIVFWYFYQNDLNKVAEGDGQPEMPNYIIVFLLSIITCGIYYFYWEYKVGNRLHSNAPRYGLQFEENGTTILLWSVIGSALCGIGNFIAMHFMIRNLNMLAREYNIKHGLRVQ